MSMVQMETEETEIIKTPKELVSGAVRLVSLPEVCIRVNQMLENPEVSAAELGRVISQDTGLAARLLKIVNSSFYGFPSRIETISRAVTIIGLRELRGLVMAASAIETFSRIPTDIFNMAQFWRHSVYCGVVAQSLAERCNVLHSERLFVAGLLHDIGKLIICNRLPNHARQIQQELTKETELDFIIEKKILGYDHADVGGELLSEWKMPQALCDAVLFHHRPNDAKNNKIEVALVHIANSLTGMAEAELDVPAEILIQPIEKNTWAILSLEETIIDEIQLEAAKHFRDALELVVPPGTY
jgi:putative nucleotidyltransferase with HDIG domain